MSEENGIEGTPKKILIVEDNQINMELLRRRLQRAGYTTVHAENGEEAIDITEKESPDLIVMDMDMDMPVMDGWTAAGIIKKSASSSHIPIIALTAHAMVGERKKALDAGCDEYETKPTNMAKLRLKIEKLLHIGE